MTPPKSIQTVVCTGHIKDIRPGKEMCEPRGCTAWATKVLLITIEGMFDRRIPLCERCAAKTVSAWDEQAP